MTSQLYSYMQSIMDAVYKQTLRVLEYTCKYGMIYLKHIYIYSHACASLYIAIAIAVYVKWLAS